jgi:hypothetical protein
MQSKSTQHMRKSKREEVSDDRPESDGCIYVNTKELSNASDADTEEAKAKAEDTPILE